MATREAITAALLAAVEAENFTLPIAWPDRSFTPPADGHLEVGVMHNGQRWGGLTSGHLKQGILQITVVRPRNLGAPKTDAVVDTVVARFPQARRIGPAKITTDPTHGDALYDANRTLVVISIPWTA